MKKKSFAEKQAAYADAVPQSEHGGMATFIRFDYGNDGILQQKSFVGPVCMFGSKTGTFWARAGDQASIDRCLAKAKEPYEGVLARQAAIASGELVEPKRGMPKFREVPLVTQVEVEPPVVVTIPVRPPLKGRSMITPGCGSGRLAERKITFI